MSLRGEDYPCVLYVKPGNKVYILNVLKQITTDYCWADKKPLHTILLKKNGVFVPLNISTLYWRSNLVDGTIFFIFRNVHQASKIQGWNSVRITDMYSFKEALLTGSTIHTMHKVGHSESSRDSHLLWYQSQMMHTPLHILVKDIWNQFLLNPQRKMSFSFTVREITRITQRNIIYWDNRNRKVKCNIKYKNVQPTQCSWY